MLPLVDVLDKKLMGFRPSPYNSIRMYLISEDIIQGDPDNPTNAFQWSHLLLNLPGTKDYKPSLAWISKQRKDKSLASDFVCFVNNLRVTGQGQERVIEAGHTISTRESWVGVQDALSKLRCLRGTKTPGAWAGASICINNDLGVVVLTSQEKWDCMKCICRFWLDLLNQGVSKLEHKQLRLDQGFMVYVAQAYPWMKPYINGFHLLLEKWRDSCNNERLKIQARPTLEDKDTRGNTPEEGSLDNIKIQLLAHSLGEEEPRQDGPSSGLTPAAPCFEEDLKAILHLAEGEHPAPRFVRSKLSMTAYYCFGVASSGGFGVTVERPSGLHSQYGLWKRDEEG
jgi:hypothetical protein